MQIAAPQSRASVLRKVSAAFLSVCVGGGGINLYYLLVFTNKHRLSDPTFLYFNDLKLVKEITICLFCKGNRSVMFHLNSDFQI